MKTSSAEEVAEICEKPGDMRSRYERKAVKEFISKVPDLSWSSPRVMEEICNNLTTSHFEAGKALMVKGEAPDCMYVIVEGSAGIYVDNDRLLYQVNKGNAVGELSLKLKSHRTATVRALEYVKALRLSAKDYDYLMLKSALAQSIEISKVLRLSPFFKAWPQGKLEVLASKVLVQTFNAGQVIYKAGDSAVNMFVLKSGSVTLEVLVELEKRNRWPTTQRSWEVCLTRRQYRKTLKVVHDLEIFGEKDLLKSQPRRTQATATKPSVVYVLDRSVVYDVFLEADLVDLDLVNIEIPSTSTLQSIVTDSTLKEATHRRALLDAYGVNLTPRGRDTLEPIRLKKIQTIARGVRRRRNSSEVVRKTVLLLKS
jgi:CRP-like cAMP-binding protein